MNEFDIEDFDEEFSEDKKQAIKLYYQNITKKASRMVIEGCIIYAAGILFGLPGVTITLYTIKKLDRNLDKENDNV